MKTRNPIYKTRNRVSQTTGTNSHKEYREQKRTEGTHRRHAECSLSFRCRGWPQVLVATFVVNPCHQSVPGSREEPQKKKKTEVHEY
jgi:hypothetical protein